MMTLTISEACGLLSSSYFWLIVRANPASPGSAALPISQSVVNLGIMLFGELVVTDGIVAYFSNAFKDRYVVNLALAWNELKTRRKSLMRYMTAILMLGTSQIILNLPHNMCFTSPDYENINAPFALTSCPEIPQNITEMLRVGEMFYDEWQKYQ